MFSVYKIGVEIVAKNEVSAALKAITKDVLQLGRHTDALTAKFGKLRLGAIAAGTVTAAAGLAMARGLWDAGKAADHLVQAQQRLRQMGVSQKNMLGITNAAQFGIQATPTVDIAEAVQLGAKLRTILGSSVEAIKALPTAIRAEGILTGWGMGGSTAFADLAKAIEMRGGVFKEVNGKPEFSVSEFSRNLTMALAAQNIAGKLLTPAVIRQATKLAGPAAKIMGANAWWTTMAEAAQQLGPGGARGIASVYSAFLGGRIARAATIQMEQLGIARRVQWIQGSGQAFIPSGGLLGNETLLKQGLFKWVEKVLVPDLVKHGFKTLNQQLAAVYRFVPTITGQRIIANMIENPLAYERTARQMAIVPGTDEIYQQQLATMKGAMQQLTGAWRSFIDVVGSPLARMAAHGLQEITTGVMFAEKWAASHPKAVKLIDQALVGVSAGLTALGSAVVAEALLTIMSPTAGLVALAGGITALSAAVKGVPPWLVHMVQGAAAGAAIAGPGGALAGAVGGGLWNANPLGLNNITPKQALHRLLHPALKPAPIGGILPPPHETLLQSLQRMPQKAAVPHRAAAAVPVEVVGGHHHVTVDNGRDLAHGVSKAQAGSMSRNPSGPTGFNARQSFFAPGIAIPAPP